MKNLLTFAVFLFFTQNLFAQSLTLTPGNQGKLNLPKLTYDQIQAIPTPESGSIVYDVTTNCIRFYNGTKWLCTDQKVNDFAPNALNAWKVSELDPINNFQCNHIAVDNQGNIYVTGTFTDNFRVNGITYTPLGYADVFVIKYNNSGTAQWVKTGGTVNSYSSPKDIAIDNQGNVFVGGHFFNTFNFDGTSISANNGSQDLFLCKLSASNGGVLAIKAIGGSNFETFNEIFVDNQGNVFIVGNYIGSCNFDAISITGIDNYDIFIAKCNNNLQFQWANKITGVSSDDGRGIYGDNAGNIYITGYIASNATFAPGVTLNPGNQIMFVAKYNASNGNYIWHRNQINTGLTSLTHRIVCDSEGNIYIGGAYSVYINLGVLQYNSTEGSDLFIAKINSSGVWQWLQQSKSSDYYDVGQVYDMKINANDEIFIVCKTNFNPTFGFGIKRYLGNNFVFKFDKNGGVKGGNVIPNTGYNNYIQSIAFNGNYHYLTGYFSGSMSFGNTSLASPTYNGFVAKFVE